VLGYNVTLDNIVIYEITEGLHHVIMSVVEGAYKTAKSYDNITKFVAQVRYRPKLVLKLFASADTQLYARDIFKSYYSNIVKVTDNRYRKKKKYSKVPSLALNNLAGE